MFPQHRNSLLLKQPIIMLEQHNHCSANDLMFKKNQITTPTILYTFVSLTVNVQQNILQSKEKEKLEYCDITFSL